MIIYLLLTVYCLLFILITWHYFHLGLVLFFLLLPTYLIRFHLGPLPTTLLEVMIWIITIIWLIKYKSNIRYQIADNIKKYPTLFISTGLFLIAATISVLTSINLRAALGEWKAFYVEPILIFIILITTLNPFSDDKQKQDQKIKGPEDQKLSGSFDFPIFRFSFTNTIIYALILSGLITSILAIYQHFTGWLVPYSFWQNQNTFRVTAWYGFPNAVGLFLAPLVPLAIYLIKQKLNEIKKRDKRYKIRDSKNKFISYLLSPIFIDYLQLIFIILLIPLSITAIIFAKSTSALIGLAVGLGFLLLFNKKTRWVTISLGLVSFVCLVSLPSFSEIKQELLLQDRSGQIRTGIWQETFKFLSVHPIAGAGLASYANKIKPYHTTINGEGIEIFHHPHNIFLTMWVNLGLLGLISFILILIWFFRIALSPISYRLSNKSTIKPFIIASMIIILVMGLVDSPYIKNDLAILFWLLPALLIVCNNQSQSV